MAHLGDANVVDIIDENNTIPDAQQYEGLIPPYQISGQIFPRSTP
jgi:hypothetical protein